MDSMQTVANTLKSFQLKLCIIFQIFKSSNFLVEIQKFWAL